MRIRFVLAALGALLIVGIVAVLDASTGSRRSPRNEGESGQSGLAQHSIDSTPSIGNTERDAAIAKNQSVLPSAYSGDRVIRGVVLRSGVPVPAVVECVPDLFAPRDERERAELTQYTNERGHFEFRDFPRAGKYLFRAISKHGAAIETVRDVTGLVRLTVQSAVYERIRFVDQGGLPVDLRGRRAAIGGSLLLEVDKDLFLRSWGRISGVDTTVQANEVVEVYKRLRGKVRGLGPRVIRVEGYLPVPAVPVQSTALANWPQVTATVTLREDKGASKHVVRFPSFTRPKLWRQNHTFALSVLSADGALSIVTPAHNQFWAAHGKLRILYLNREIEYRVRREEGEILVMPNIQGLSFVSIQYPSSSGTYLLLGAEDTGMAVPLHSVCPGLVRSIVPSGQYRVALTQNGKGPGWDAYKRLVFGPGEHDVDLR